MRNVVLQTGGGALGPVAEWLQNLSPAEGAVLALVVGLILGVGSKHLWDRFTADDEPDMDFADVLDEETLKEGEAERRSSTIFPSRTSPSPRPELSNGKREPHGSASSGRRRCTSLTMPTIPTTGI